MHIEPFILSVLICTLEDRKELLLRLLDVLEPQCQGKPIEILVESDNGQVSIGEKRQKLLERATGKYVCFIDDDDLVSEKYIEDIFRALWIKSDATHCSLKGILRQPNKADRRFEHSNLYKAWATIDGKYVRPPNHVNVIRRDLALQAGFTSINWGEDKAFSEKLVELGTLIHEAWIEPVLYIYCLRASPMCPNYLRGTKAIIRK